MITFDINLLFSQTEVVTSIVIITYYSIQIYSFIFTLSNVSKYCHLIPIIQFMITVKDFQILPFKTYNSIQDYSIVCSQVSGLKYCYVTI